MNLAAQCGELSAVDIVTRKQNHAAGMGVTNAS